MFVLINHLHVFKSSFDEIIIPDEVYQETVVGTELIQQKKLILTAIDIGYIKVVETAYNHPFRRKLGLGERGVLNLAIEKDALQIIIDDKRARNEAVELGIPIMYTTDVLKIADGDKVISYSDVMTQLHAIGIYLPE